MADDFFEHEFHNAVDHRSLFNVGGVTKFEEWETSSEKIQKWIQRGRKFKPIFKIITNFAN